MKKGKIAAQCCHATQGVLETIRNAGAAPHLKMWNTIGRKKVVLKVPGEEELLRIQKHAESVGLPTYIVQVRYHCVCVCVCVCGRLYRGVGLGWVRGKLDG